jgi:hypothetical protein
MDTPATTNTRPLHAEFNAAKMGDRDASAKVGAYVDRLHAADPSKSKAQHLAEAATVAKAGVESREQSLTTPPSRQAAAPAVPQTTTPANANFSSDDRAGSTASIAAVIEFCSYANEVELRRRFGYSGSPLTDLRVAQRRRDERAIRNAASRVAANLGWTLGGDDAA